MKPGLESQARTNLSNWTTVAEVTVPICLLVCRSLWCCEHRYMSGGGIWQDSPCVWHQRRPVCPCDDWCPHTSRSPHRSEPRTCLLPATTRGRARGGAVMQPTSLSIQQKVPHRRINVHCVAASHENTFLSFLLHIMPKRYRLNSRHVTICSPVWSGDLSFLPTWMWRFSLCLRSLERCGEIVAMSSTWRYNVSWTGALCAKETGSLDPVKIFKKYIKLRLFFSAF